MSLREKLFPSFQPFRWWREISSPVPTLSPWPEAETSSPNILSKITVKPKKYDTAFHPEPLDPFKTPETSAPIKWSKDPSFPETSEPNFLYE